ncbi:MAG: AmmeMemoRadiSam system protein A [Nanoarchaeota archaeon]|nr:AmmeMemoRadiSam system protein A [Nanoarchaeota archaeon]MBU4299866.1 AmmeMemoRadiSam system protein A [Nanoarchaeota archaeon]MBU4451646.1 AmmeMemoRadiSam system protein A [Nanoarchaeota archaeon]MCG2723633.1 AmmeMemoRadiSam system protein A [archaeon]
MDKQTEIFACNFVNRTIMDFVKNEKAAEIPKKHPIELDEKRGVFVTLKKNKELRGCVGFCGTRRKIIENLRDAAIESCRDSRFLPICTDELPYIDFEVSILTEPRLIKSESSAELLKKIIPKKDGLIIECNGNGGLFLPQVWIELPEKEEFLRHLCLKTGLKTDAWKNGARIYKFNAEIIEGTLK